MKLTAVLFSAMFSVVSSAQTVGVEVGVAASSYDAMSNHNVNPNVRRTFIFTTPKPGLVLGAHADFGLNSHLYLRAGLLMIVKGGVEEGLYLPVNGTGAPYPYSNKLNFVAFDAPLSLVYKTASAGKPRWLFGAGLVPGLLIEGGLNKFDFGAGVLVGYEMPSGLHGNLSYNHGLANVATNSFDYKSLYNRSLAFTVGYHFGHKTKAEVEKIKVIEEESLAAPERAEVLYAELGGPAGMLTLNYDTRFTKSPKGFGLRVGAGIIFDITSTGFVLPVALNYVMGKKTHFLELAAGGSYFSFTEENQGWFYFPEDNFIVPFVWAGYRYQPLGATS